MKEQRIGKFIDSLDTDKSAWVNAATQRKNSLEWKRKSQMIALRVLSELHERGLKQKDLAESMNVSPQQISKIVKGKENLTLETISKIESVLQISLISIHYQADSIKSKSVVTSNIKTDFKGARFELYTVVKDQKQASFTSDANESYKMIA